MRLGLCTTIAGGGGLSAAAFQLGLTGLTDGAARPGDHGALGYTIDPDQGTETVLWGVAPDDDTYGTGAQPSDYSAADGATLWLTCTDDGQTVYLSAPIRYGAGAAPVIADGQSWTVDDTGVSLDASAAGANLTWGYGATGLPDGVVINATTGAITGTPTVPGSGTGIVTATDQYGRTVQESFTWETALRAQAVAANGLGPFSFTVGDDAMDIDFVADFTAHGNALDYVITGLPSGGIDNGDGTASGFASIAGQSGPIVCTATDEYGRETTSTASCVTQLRAPAFTAGALLDRDWIVDDAAVDLDLTGDFTAAGNTLSYAVTGLPAGLNDDGDGSISGTPTADGQSGTITIIGTDEYGRQAASAFSYTTAYRDQATGGPALDLALVEGTAATATYLAQTWGGNGNTLSLVSLSPTLPAGLTLSGGGILSGTPTAIAADDTYTLTMQDEYGRQTSDIFTLEVLSNTDSTAPTASALSAGIQDGSGDVTVTVDDLDEDSTAHWVLVAAGSSVPSSVQVVAGQDASASPAADSGSFAATMTGGPYGQSLVPNLDASFDLHVVFRDASGNNSDVYSDTGINIDTIAPGLMAVTVSNPGASTASWEAFTSESGGTIHVRPRPVGDPAWTAQEILADANDSHSPAEVSPALFLIIGQSNAIGRATFDNGDVHPANTVQWTGSEAAVTIPLDHLGEEAGDMGFDIVFARSYRAANPDQQIVLIPYAQGGTGFNSDDWNPGDTLYDGAVARANGAIAHYGVNSLSGILWHQGESDSSAPATYEDDLLTMIDTLRADITGAATVPFVAGEIVEANVGDQDINAVLGALENTSLATALVETGDLSTDDGIHFDAASLRTLGARYFTAWGEARGNVSINPPVISGTPTIVGAVQVGAALTVAAASVSPGNAVNTFSWRVDGTEVGTGTGYTPQAADQGGTLTVVQTATTAGGSDTATSVGQVVAAASAGSVSDIQAAVDASVSDAFWAPTDDAMILWQDAAKTVSVTADQDPIRIIDATNGTLDLDTVLTTGDDDDRRIWYQADGLTGKHLLPTGNNLGIHFTAGTLGSDMYLAFVANTSQSGRFFLAGGDGARGYIGYANPSDTNTSMEKDASVASYRVDGVSVATRGDLFAALTDGADHVVECVGCDLTHSNWIGVQVALGARPVTARIEGLTGDYVLCDTPSSADQDKIRAALAARHGVTL